MKRLIIIFIFAGLYGCKHNTVCSDFRNGKFYSYSKTKRNKVSFEMHDSSCILFNSKTGVADTNDIIWNNPCQFLIKGKTHVDPKNPDKIFTGLNIIVHIIESNNRFVVLKRSFYEGDLVDHGNDTLWIDK